MNTGVPPSLTRARAHEPVRYYTRVHVFTERVRGLIRRRRPRLPVSVLDMAGEAEPPRTPHGSPGDVVTQLGFDGDAPPTVERRRSTPPRRFCKCEEPYFRKNWDVGPDGGSCRTCGNELRKMDVRRLHAIARDEQARIAHKFPDLVDDPVKALREAHNKVRARRAVCGGPT